MSHLLRWGMVSSLAFSGVVFAFNPMQGFYAGVFGEVSHGPTSYLLDIPDPSILNPPIADPPFPSVLNGRVYNTKIGGGGGGQIGFRLCNFRLEGEVLYNYVSVNKLALPNCTLVSPNAVSPVGVGVLGCPDEGGFFDINGTGFNGSTSGLYGFINGFFDFYSTETDCPFFPYIGVGVGAARIQNRINFVNSLPPAPLVPLPSAGAKVSFNTAAAQGIIGFGYYIDDFAWAGVDYRYVTTGNISNISGFIVENSPRYAIHTINFLVNFAFNDCSN